MLRPSPPRTDRGRNQQDQGRPQHAAAARCFPEANGAVRLKMLADVGNRGPHPVLESAVRIHANAKADLDFTFDRGIVNVVNVKKAGAARVRARFQGKTWGLTLAEPGTRVGMEIY